MKKLLSVALSMILLVALASGCASEGKNKPSGDNRQTQADTSNFIGDERAREIALEQAGISSEGVVFDRVELDFDNGKWEYEVEFRKDRIEYDAVIGAEDGNVISFETDRDD